MKLTTEKYLLAIDQGTSSTKTLILDADGKSVCKATVPLKTHYLSGGKVEQEPEAIYENVLDSVRKCLEEFVAQGRDSTAIKACGISNQRETFVLWDKHGKPFYHAIVWQCKRSIAVCDRLKSSDFEVKLHQKTGLIVDPYFSGTKVLWLYENEPDIRKAIARGEVYFGNIDTWLLYRMTGGRSYKTDYTNASRTMFFNLHELQWDQELLEDFGLSKLNLPALHPSCFHYGETNFEGLLDHDISISAMIGDSHAAAFGERCFEAGDAKATLGTGSSILMNIGGKPKMSSRGMVTTICWSMEGRIDYALEGIIVSAGATIEWVKNQLGLFENTEDLEKICLSLEDNGSVYLVPAFSGLGAPHWDMNRKASIAGLTLDSSKAHVIRAAVESVPYQIKDVIVAMEEDAGTALTALKVDGGMTSNKFVLRFLADLLNRKVVNMQIADVSAIGAGFLAGLEVGVYRDLERLQSFDIHCEQTPPGVEVELAEKGYEGWKQVVLAR